MGVEVGRRRRLRWTFLLVLMVMMLVPAVAGAEADVGIRDVAEGNVPGLTVAINGSGITYYGDSIRLTFQNDTTEPLVVHVPIGTQLIPANVSTQTMITAGGENITVPPGGSQVVIKAFCGEQNDHAPSSGDTFTVGDRVTGNLLSTAENINRERAFDYDGQTAIWHLTDGAAVGEGSTAEQLIGSGLSDGEKAATAIIVTGSAIAAAAAAGGSKVSDDDLLPDEDLFPDEDWDDFDEDDFEDWDDPEEQDAPEADLFPDEDEPDSRPNPDEVNEHTGQAIDELTRLRDQMTLRDSNRPTISQLIKVDGQLAATIESIENSTDPRDWGPDDINGILGTIAGLVSIGLPPAAIASVASAIAALYNQESAQMADDLRHQTRNLLADLHNMRGNVRQSIDDLSNAQPPPQVPNVDPGTLPDSALEPTIAGLHNQAMDHLTTSHSLEQQIHLVRSQLENSEFTSKQMSQNISLLKDSEDGAVATASALISIVTGAAGGAVKSGTMLAQAVEVVSTVGTSGGFVDWVVSLSGPEQQELYRACLNRAEYQRGMLSRQLESLQQQHAQAQQAFDATSKLRTAVSNEYNSRFGRMPPRHLFGGGS